MAYGYSCSQFVELAPEHIRCGVCRNVLRDPQLTECCGRNVCHPCIEEAMKISGPCPLAECKRPHVKVSFNRTCRNNIDERMVYCSSKSNGCQWIDKLEKLERHLAECSFVEEECPYQCGAHVQRQHMKDHEVICKQYPIKCQQCGEIYERQHQSQHSNLCAFTKLKCPFSIVGCTSEVLNKDLPQHFCDFLPDHCALVAKLNQDMQAKMEVTKGLLLQEYEEKTTQLKAEIDGLNTAIFTAHERISVLQQSLCKGEKEIGDFQKAHETTKYNFIAQIGVGEAEIKALREGIKQLHFDSKVKLYGPPLPRPYQIVSRPPEMPPTADPLTPPFTFTITDFPKKMKHDVVVHSPPFFTHHRGYKMCLQVYCNGNDRGKGKFLSIFAYLLKGEYDDFLRWPFYGSIRVEIRNLLNYEFHHVQIITFGSHSNAGTRVEGDECLPSKSLGYWNFLPFSALFPAVGFFSESHYIENGCLKINVTNIKVFS